MADIDDILAPHLELLSNYAAQTRRRGSRGRANVGVSEAAPPRAGIGMGEPLYGGPGPFVAGPAELQQMEQPFSWPGDTDLPPNLEDPYLKSYQPMPHMPLEAPFSLPDSPARVPEFEGALAQMGHPYQDPSQLPAASSGGAPFVPPDVRGGGIDPPWISDLKRKSGAQNRAEAERILESKMLYGLTPGTGNLPLKQLGEWGKERMGRPHPTMGGALPASGVNPSFSPYELEVLQGVYGSDLPPQFGAP